VSVFRLERLSATYWTGNRPMPAVRDVSLSISQREALGLVGESGSGKTTLALASMGYLPGNGTVTGGSAWLGDTDLLTLSRRELRSVWGSRVGLVSQSPAGAFNPSLTIGRQLDEMGLRHLGLGRRAARDRTLSMLDRVEMPDPRSVVSRYPHQLSGGMLQRSAIAMALVTNPELLILDEPTTALDVTTQATILDLLEELKSEFSSAILYITHNLGVVSRVCDRIGVMYAGEMFEEAGTSALFDIPLHPYTVNLINCVPRFEQTPALGRLANISGSLPALDDLPTGCVFAPRCPLTVERCRESRPPLIEVQDGHRSACWRWELLRSADGRQAALQLPEGATFGAESRRGRARFERGGHFVEAHDVVKVFRSQRYENSTRAVDGVTVWMDRGRTLGLVGESGCGKTTLARVISGLTVPNEGAVFMGGARLKPDATSRDRTTLKRLQVVFQNPDASLNPRRTVREALARPLIVLGGLDRGAAADRARELLSAVRLPAAYLDRYPAELSGGEKQRVAIARAFAADPDLVICDEPISSLDVSVQGSLMNLLLDLQDERRTSYLFISHDLAAVQHLSHRIGVMYLGRLLEVGEAERVLAPPHHPYTEALLSAVPILDPEASRGRVHLRSGPPPTGDVPSGCRFHPRCPRFLGPICAEQEPPWHSAGETAHAICCHIPLDELARLQAGAE
jgi:peptide/nickel transport system ATP-binding protein